jgi:hypothetical protein
LAPQLGAVQFPEQEEPLCRRHPPRRWRLLGRWRSRRSTPARDHSSWRWSRRSSRTSSPRVEEPPEHHWVWHAGEVPLRISMRSGGWQLVGGALGRLVTGGGARIPGNQDVTARGNPAQRRVGVGVGDICRRGAAQTDREARSGDRALPRRGGYCLAGERIALRGAEGPATSVLAGAGIAATRAAVSGTDPAWRRARSSSRLVRRIR